MDEHRRKFLTGGAFGLSAGALSALLFNPDQVSAQVGDLTILDKWTELNLDTDYVVKSPLVFIVGMVEEVKTGVWNGVIKGTVDGQTRGGAQGGHSVRDFNVLMNSFLMLAKNDQRIKVAKSYDARRNYGTFWKATVLVSGACDKVGQ